MKINVDELVYMSRMCDAYAQETLFWYFRLNVCGMIKGRIAPSSKLAMYREDIIQETMVSLYEIVDCYRGDRNTSCATFITNSLQKRLFSALRRYARMASAEVSTQTLEIKFGEDQYYGFVAAPKTVYDPEYSLNYSEAVRRMNHTYLNMSETDREYVRAWAMGEKHMQLADRLNRKVKTVDKRMHQVKKKMRRAILSDESH